MAEDRNPQRQKIGRPERTQYILDLLTNAGKDGKCETRTMQIVKLVMDRFGVSNGVAFQDVKHARAKLWEAVNEATPYLGAQIKDSLMRLAVKAEDVADFRGAAEIWGRLAKSIGLHDTSDEAAAAKLSPEQLEVQLRAAVAARIQAMEPEEIEAIIAAKGEN